MYVDVQVSRCMWMYINVGRCIWMSVDGGGCLQIEGHSLRLTNPEFSHVQKSASWEWMVVVVVEYLELDLLGFYCLEPKILTVASKNRPQSMSEEASHQQDSPQVSRLGGSLLA